MPATTAAAYSPALCPATTDGRTPHERHSSVERVLEGEQRRLGVAHAVEQTIVAEQDRRQRLVEHVAQQLVAAIDGSTEDRAARRTGRVPSRRAATRGP